MSNSAFDELYGDYKTNYDKTYADPDLGSAREIMDYFFGTWAGEFIHAIEHDLRRKYDLDQNIYLAFLSTQTMVWDWMAFSIKCGHYNLVARELRSILESIALFIHIECSKPRSSLQDKIAYWMELESEHKVHGKTVFRYSGMTHWEEHYQIYRELCQFTHPGVGTYRADIELMAVTGQSLDFEFDKKKFLAVFDLWMKVANIACDAAVKMYETLGEKPVSFGPHLYRSP